MPRRRPARVEPGPHLVFHPDWAAQVGGVSAPVVCDIRPASAPDLADAAGLLTRAGCREPLEPHASGGSVLLLAWTDPEVVVPDLTTTRPGARSRSDGPGPARPAPATRDGAAVRAVLAARATAHEPAAGRSTDRDASPLLAVGCVEIRWGGSSDPTVRHLAGDSVELVHLYVEPSVRRRGIGRALLAAAEHRCLLAGRTRLVTVVPAAAATAGAAGRPPPVDAAGAPVASMSGRRGQQIDGPVADVGGTVGRVGGTSGPVGSRSAGRTGRRPWGWALTAGYRPLCGCTVPGTVAETDGCPGPGRRVDSPAHFAPVADDDGCPTAEVLRRAFDPPAGHIGAGRWAGGSPELPARRTADRAGGGNGPPGTGLDRTRGDPAGGSPDRAGRPLRPAVRPIGPPDAGRSGDVADRVLWWFRDLPEPVASRSRRSTRTRVR